MLTVAILLPPSFTELRTTFRRSSLDLRSIGQNRSKKPVNINKILISF